LISTIVLVCGVLASLALGVWIAYGVCVGMFRLFRIHARQIAAAKSVAQAAPVPRLDAVRN
jgi:uncharacterized membrane protein